MTDDDSPIDLAELAPDEIHELLCEAGVMVTLEQVQQIADFVDQTGSIAAALEALGHVDQPRRAA